MAQSKNRVIWNPPCFPCRSPGPYDVTGANLGYSVTSIPSSRHLENGLFKAGILVLVPNLQDEPFFRENPYSPNRSFAAEDGLQTIQVGRKALGHEGKYQITAQPRSFWCGISSRRVRIVSFFGISSKSPISDQGKPGPFFWKPWPYVRTERRHSRTKKHPPSSESRWFTCQVGVPAGHPKKQPWFVNGLNEVVKIAGCNRLV